MCINGVWSYFVLAVKRDARTCVWIELMVTPVSTHWEIYAEMVKCTYFYLSFLIFCTELPATAILLQTFDYFCDFQTFLKHSYLKFVTFDNNLLHALMLLPHQKEH